jgi:uncharacterized metal-binding protein
MSVESSSFSLTVEGTVGTCPIGETVGIQNLEEGKIPVFSCEGACIRGEIARLAANLVAKETPYRRGCHGELFTVPHSAMARWARAAAQVVVIDGCFLRCHARVMRRLISDDRLVELDALSRYKKHTDIFDIDGVPEAERHQLARDVAGWVLETMSTSAQPRSLSV